jgi:hypothetical protein
MMQELAVAADLLLLQRSLEFAPLGNAKPTSAQRVRKNCRRFEAHPDLARALLRMT